MTVLLLVVLFVVCGVTTHAEDTRKGSVEILLEDENVTFEYAKVADLVDGDFVLKEQYKKTAIDFNHMEYSQQMAEAAQKLDKCVEEGKKVKTDAEGKAVISELDVGVYLLRVTDKGGEEYVSPTLISIPTWNEEEGGMNYHITVIPKHSPEGVATGDTHFYQEYLVLFGISFIFLVGLTCHTYFKCGKIKGNYSEKGGRTYGNDNDTKDSRCTRRLRPRGGRSVD